MQLGGLAGLTFFRARGRKRQRSTACPRHGAGSSPLSYRALPPPHTLRHSFASVADDLGYSEATIGAMLGHSVGSTTRKYIHKLDPALVSAADRVAERISEMMNGTAQTAEIVPIQRTA